MNDESDEGKHGRRRVGILLYLRGYLSVAVLLGASWSLAFWIFGSLLGWPSERGTWIRGVAELSLALFVFTAFATVMGKIFAKRHSRDLFANMIEAMRRIAEGDFSATVQLKSPEREGPFQEVAASLNQMAEALGRIESMRQEFISDVSHEIQSPLTSIGGFARALRAPSLGEDERLHYLDIIESESGRLSRIAADLLRLSALESSAQRVERENFRLDTQLRNVILSCEPQWRDKGIDVGASCDEAFISADPALLWQVWTNLLHNAIKFTPDGGTIDVAARKTEGSVVVEIADSGIGIAVENLPMVFGRFFKADKGRSAAAGGSGLGLSIAKKIMELHGGTIEAKSEGPGRGTTFRVELPVGIAP